MGIQVGLQTAIFETQTLLKLLEKPELKQILSISGCETQVDGLQCTVTTIHAKLRNAEGNTNISKSHNALGWITAVKTVVYDTNIQLEKLITLAAQKQLFKADADGGLTLYKKMRLYFHCFNRHGVPYKMSKLVNYITSFCDDMAKASWVMDNVVPDPTFLPESWELNRDETCYFVYDKEVVGREEDLENIISMLLYPNNERYASFLSIAGVAGLGKTTLAQLVYNDSRVVEAFSFRRWVSISGRDHGEGNEGFILRSATSVEYQFSTMSELLSLIRPQLSGNKCLLVLDNLWAEMRDELQIMADDLIEGQRGSWILVTTRSREIATVMGDGQLYELEGLSEESSSQLFRKVAYRESWNNTELMAIPQQILAQCARIPLAIIVDGNRLFYHDNRENHLISILRPSYDSLESSLKRCFIYCALFPKDFTINKDMLISLWMAQDYILPLNTRVSTEDVGEEYFSTLLDKYLLKDVKRDKYGEIVSCKIPDFAHELAQHLAEGEMYMMLDIEAKVGVEVHHVSVLDRHLIGYDVRDYYTNHNILSYIYLGYNNAHFSNLKMSSLELLLAQCRSLKALDLSGLSFDSLPDSIGELSLLKYLNLFGNTELEVLPRTITKLENLQTLNLQKCYKLKELPKDTSKLGKLRLLNTRSCSSLTCMPRGIGKLTCLHKLSDFKVSGEGSYTSWKEVFDALDDLKPLDNLLGHLNIEIRCPSAKYAASEVARRERLYPLKSKDRLKAVGYDFKHVGVDGALDSEGVTRLMKELQPPSNLQYIKVWGYQGLRMGWDTFPSNLVELVMVGCSELECLPCLGNLHHLKVLQLLKLKKLEYIGHDIPFPNSGSYYPSLETVRFEILPKLKGWRIWAVDDHVYQILDDKGGSSSSDKAQWQLLPCFSQLKSLFIWNCPLLTWIPPCPTVEDLKLVNFNSSLRIIKSIESGKNLDVASTSASRNGIDIPECSSSRRYIQNGKKIKKLALSNVAWLISQPVEAFKHLENLEIWCDKEVESLGEVEEVFRSCSSSLRILIIHNCSNLKSVVPGGLKHLTALEKLELRNCDNLTLSEERGEHEENEEDSIAIRMMNWSSNLQSLHTLKLDGLPQLVNLPDWMQFLPSLQCLCISYCNKIKSLPDWMPKITSLRQIIVHGCSARLEKRCREHEQDWPHIQFQFRNCVF